MGLKLLSIKDFSQIKDIKNSYLALDDIEVGELKMDI